MSENPDGAERETKDIKEKGSEENKSSGEGSPDEDQLGTLEKPIEILTRKRERKSSSNTPKAIAEEKMDYSEGNTWSTTIRRRRLKFVRHIQREH